MLKQPVSTTVYLNVLAKQNPAPNGSIHKKILSLCVDLLALDMKIPSKKRQQKLLTFVFPVKALREVSEVWDCKYMSQSLLQRK